MAANGAPVEMPTARKPGGSRVTRTPWLIHTCARSPSLNTPSNSGVSSLISSSGRPDRRRVVDDLKLGAAELAVMPAPDLPAERSHHGLLAITDAKHRHAGGEQRLRRLRRAGLVHAGRPARQDDGAWPGRRA